MDALGHFFAIEEAGKYLYQTHRRYLVDVRPGRSGPWRVRHRVTRCDLTYARLWRSGRPPGIGRFTYLQHEDRGTVMSDTVPEVLDVLANVPKLRGNILMTGLGLGMVIHILKLREYRAQWASITVVEKEGHVIDLVAGRYTGRKVRIIHADAMEWSPDKHYDIAWHDIWDVSPTGPEQRAIKARYRSYATEQICWKGRG
jgi:hypothetical protein